MPSYSFSADTLAHIQTIISRYPEGKQKSAILPVLHIAQQEFGGWLSPEAMDYVAEILNILPIEVYEVATFYTMFKLSPTGKYVLEVCRTGPCCLMGADELIENLEARLGISVGETTPDGLFTLKPVECLASCGTAPVVQVGECYFENVSPQSVESFLHQVQQS
jgi:NADH-quinone oxidoreductase subunit E